MTPTTAADKVKEIAYDAWKAAANAYRLYPDNKHTFAAYWHTEGSRLVGELVEGWVSVEADNVKLMEILRQVAIGQVGETKGDFISRITRLAFQTLKSKPLPEPPKLN